MRRGFSSVHFHAHPNICLIVEVRHLECMGAKKTLQLWKDKLPAVHLRVLSHVKKQNSSTNVNWNTSERLQEPTQVRMHI